MRPNGPGTLKYLSLSGICNNEPPQYVVSIGGSSGSYINLGTNAYMQMMGNVTLTIWARSTQSLTGTGCSGGAALLFGQWITGSQNNNVLFWSDTCTQYSPEMLTYGGYVYY